jgi:nicotinamidase/pyrazinamidase
MNQDAVLIVVDVQNGFTPGGGLPVPRGDEVVPVINRIGKLFGNVVITQDWHPAGHASFASSYTGKAPYDMMTMPYGPQVLWPDHCVQGTHDAALHKDLHLPQAQLIIRKGFHPQVDSYSAFMEADRTTTTGLAAYLQARGLRKAYVCGLATDFCVAWTALDVIEDACRAIDLNGSLAQAWKDLQAAGVQRLQTTDLE